jgi:hypothetical protein
MMGKRLASAAILLLALALVPDLCEAAGKPKTAGNPKAAVQPKPARPPEEGTWKVTVVPDAEASAKGEREFDDTLILSKGKLKSTAGVPYGFGEVPYRTEAGTIMAEMSSPKEGTNHWHAEVGGDTIAGKMTWTKSDGTVLHYSFSGARAGKQGPQTQKSQRRESAPLFSLT